MTASCARRPSSAPTMQSSDIKPLKPQSLGPNQLKWLDEKFQFYRIHRKQAEVSVGMPGHTPETSHE